MKFWKSTNQFSLLIVCLFAFIAISCKESSIPTESTNKILNAETIEKLQAAADKVMMENQTPGMMAYISVDGEGEGIYITRGVSNLTTSEPMNINNYFRIGSITKTFTTEAVLILVDEGKIDLNKPISFYLPELNIPSGDKITIPMLANMSSGLFDYSSDMNLWTPYINSNEEKVFTPEELLVLSFSHPLLFEPGTEYNYCNANTVLLGLLIKKVTGKEVRDVFSEKILQPLGMKNTFWPITNYLPYPYNHGYTSLLTGSLIESTNWNTSWADAAGILISNISDMKIWTKELYDRKLLSDKMKSERFAWIDDIPGIKYSGFGVEKVFDWIGKSGSIFGYNSEAWYNPVKKITIIINTNSNDGLPADNVFASFIDILTPYK
ncbi:MAG: serine hydrolase domain-containing protein [Ignavibacteria bacterium]|nr:serine hydrolase domain-containing protein [Ignavibacteria bacterium]